MGPLSLSLYQGEILGVRGPNGAGKSTFLKLLATVTKPASGTYQHKGIKTIGYIPQEIALYETMTGMENLHFWGRVYGLSGKSIRKRSEMLLQAVELQEKAKQKLCTYSGGMKRRLHLASALMVLPQLLLLDEPTVGADMHSSALILGILEQLRQQGCTIVLISHQQGELEQTCNRILTLDNGKAVGLEEVFQ